MNRTVHSRFEHGLPLVLLLLLAISVAAPSAFAAKAGNVVIAKGAVQASMDGKSRGLQRRSEIQEQETVTTGAASRTQLRFVDGALLTLNENAELAITEYTYRDPGGKPDKVLLRLAKGGFRTVTGAIGKTDHSAYKVETPLASIGIRGTLFSVFYDIVKEILEVIVEQGRVLVTSETGSIMIGPGEQYTGVRVRADGSFEPFVAPGTRTGPGRTDEDPGKYPGESDDHISIPSRTGGSDSNSLSNELEGNPPVGP